MGVDVRDSRDGDRYHYYWAGTRALRLLDLNGDVQAVWVEGLPESEKVDGEEVVDVAEYFGGIDAESATRWHYTQVKHSTKRVDVPITASELKTTLEKLAQLDREASDRRLPEDRVTFAFVANRTLNGKVSLSLQELREGLEPFTYPTEANLLRRYLGYEDDRISERDFCRRLEIRDGGPGVAELERRLLQEVNQFLPGGGTGGELAQLLEMVSRCATSLAPTQRLLRNDVLVALRVTEEELFPAPSMIEPVAHPVLTTDVGTVTRELKVGECSKVLLTAVGGTGKSVLTTQLASGLPSDSVVIVYDCFAGGDYRRASALRHHHRAALTQLSNELAAKGLCTPLVPAPADEGAYTRVFMRRVMTAAAELAELSPDALLTVVVDAADNAAIAAREFRERSFVTDLLRETWPSNSRLVVLCRPERAQLLNVPEAGVTEVRLVGFTQAETLEHLRRTFPDATREEGAELHALSSGNPRVQAMAISGAGAVADALGELQIAALRPGHALDAMLDQQVRRLADEGHLAPDELQRLCQVIASLHPSVPLEDLAAITETSVDAIRSFAIALGRGFHVTATTLQFRDEPTETWFRSHYGLDPRQRQDLARTVESHADRSSYLAAALPQLLLEADLLDELVALALSDDRLPGDNHELVAQEVARSRARFALSATLRVGRYADAARLAVKTGALSSGRSRRLAMFRANTDLTARFMGREFVEETCAKRELAVDWPGSNLHVEAALLSHIDEFKDLARARNRSAFDNVLAILRAPDDGSDRLAEHITADVVADLALVAANLDGHEGLLDFVGRWAPDAFVGEFTETACSRLADAGRVEYLDHLVTAGGPEHAQIAAATVLFAYGLKPSQPAVQGLVELLQQRDSPFEGHRVVHPEYWSLGGVVWATIYGLREGNLAPADALRILDVHAPNFLPDYIGSRWSSEGVIPMTLAVALRIRLAGVPLDLKAVASPTLAKELETRSDYLGSQNARTFRDNIGPLLPWIECWLDALLVGSPNEIRAGAANLVTEQLNPVPSYNTPYVLHNAIAEVSTRILAFVDDDELVDAFTRWHRSAATYLGRSRLAVLRVAARVPHLQVFALSVLSQGADSILQDRTEAEMRVESLLELARTVLCVNEAEAKALFGLAVQEADLVGDDLYTRCEALLGVAEPLGDGHEAARSYRLFQIAEGLDHSDSINLRDVGARMLSMHGPTYFSCLSRARDRRTLSFRLMLEPAFGAAAEGDDQLGRLSLYAFEPSVSWKKAVQGLSEATEADVARIVNAWTRYWHTAEPEMAPTSARWEPDKPPDGLPGSSPPTLKERLSNHDFTTAEGWSASLSQMSWDDERTELAALSLDSHPTQHPVVLIAFTRSSHAGRREYVALAEEARKRRVTPALRNALHELAKSFAMRFADHISTVSYDDETLDSLAAACGTTTAKLRQMAFTEVAGHAHDLSYTDCFRLASRLAQSLDSPAAGVVFDDLAALFDDVSPPDSASDGSIESVATAPADDAACVAGVVWAALGDMSSEIRWQAAHAVTLLSRLRCHDVLSALRRFADGSASANAFFDQRFPFYAMHARMWLLLGVARSAHEPNPTPIADFATWLGGVVRSGGHAANQVLAQQALARLVSTQAVTLAESEADLLSVRRVANWVEMDWREQKARPNPLEVGESESADEAHWFFLDFDDWCRELATVFGSTERDVRRRASQVVAGLDGYSHFTSQSDPRSDAGVYSEGRSFSHHRSWPEEEPLSFYLAIHALLTVGAELAGSCPAYKEIDAAEDSYTDWLAQFLPTRHDGRWLSDRRDAPPLPSPDSVLATAGADDEWPWNMTKADFEQIAGVGGNWVTVSAGVDSDRDRLSEDVVVESALVRPTTANALLIALQNLPQGGFWLPTTDSYDYPSEAPFDLIPWLDASRLDRGIDELDGRGAKVRFPPTRPSDAVIKEFALVCDEDMREWFADGIIIMRSRIWNNRYSRSRDTEEGTSGEWLSIRADFLSEFLRAQDRYLVLQVGLRRQRVRPYYERRKDREDDFEWLDWSRKVYLVDPSGRWCEY